MDGAIHIVLVLILLCYLSYSVLLSNLGDAFQWIKLGNSYNKAWKVNINNSKHKLSFKFIHFMVKFLRYEDHQVWCESWIRESKSEIITEWSLASDLDNQTPLTIDSLPYCQALFQLYDEQSQTKYLPLLLY